MSRYCIDTSAYSHFKLGHAGVVEVLDSAEWVGVPAIVLGELWTGFRKGGIPKRTEPNCAHFWRIPWWKSLQLIMK